MSDFWSNIFRYPRFFISSVLGLILVILTPLKNLFKVPKLRVILTLFILFIVVLMYIVIQKMSGV